MNFDSKPKLYGPALGMSGHAGHPACTPLPSDGADLESDPMDTLRESLQPTITEEI